MMRGWKVWLGGLGLIATGVWKIAEGDGQAGMELIAAGLSVIGLGHKIEKAGTE